MAITARMTDRTSSGSGRTPTTRPSPRRSSPSTVWPRRSTAPRAVRTLTRTPRSRARRTGRFSRGWPAATASTCTSVRSTASSPASSARSTSPRPPRRRSPSATGRSGGMRAHRSSCSPARRSTPVANGLPLPCTCRMAVCPASSGPSFTTSADSVPTSMGGMDGGSLLGCAEDMGRRSISTSAACRDSTCIRPANRARGVQLTVTRSAVSQTPRSSLSCKRARTICRGKEPANPDKETWPSVNRRVRFSIMARPLSVLPAMNSDPVSSRSRAAAPAKVQTEILNARRIRRPAQVRCRFRRHRCRCSAA